MCGGDCEYANSRPVTLTRTSANDISTSCGVCQAMETRPRQEGSDSSKYICSKQANRKLMVAAAIPTVIFPPQDEIKIDNNICECINKHEFIAYFLMFFVYKPYVAVSLLSLMTSSGVGTQDSPVQE